MYKTTNVVNGKFYIGITNGNDKHYKGSGSLLLKAIKIYGHENFIREDLEIFHTAEEAYSREKEVVNDCFVNSQNTYNQKIGGFGGTGQKKSNLHKKNISNAIKQKYNTDAMYRKNTGRNVSKNINELVSCVELYGIKNAASMLNLTYHQCRDRYYRKLKKSRC